MKILLTVGHSILKSGACTSADGRPYGGVLEYAYNKGIINRVAEYLRAAGHTADVLICPELQFSRSTEEKDYKLSRANSGGYDLVVELHLNASALHNARGCEVLYISDAGKIVAQRIQAQLATVFKDRGIQKRSGLYMLNSTKPVAVMLGIKPVLHVDEEGKLIPMEKVRGRKASLDALVKHFAASTYDRSEQVVFVSHGDCLEDCRYVADKIAALGVKRVCISTIGPVIGAHSGPGTVALFFRADKR